MMKKIFLMLLATMSVVLCAQAMPAYPYPVKITQPDGSQITIQLFGDEHFHWAQTTDGYNVIQREDGYYYYDAPVLVRAHDVAQRGAADREVLSRTRRGMPSEATAAFQHAAMLQQTAEAHNQHTREVIQRAAGDKFHSLVILVNFSDKVFVTANAQQAFTNLLNQDGYSVNGGTGSAWNYYQDNSNLRFDPSFDVYGPFTIDQTVLSHGGGTSNMTDFVKKACAAAKAAGVNFADYADNGTARDIFFFFAGYDQARGAPSGTIWSHRGGGGTITTIDGIKVSGYACTSELTGTSGTTMAAIGTFCHEFGHVLGWPDFYDTDYSTNGSALYPDTYSLMASGAYNNSSRTPPSLMAMERDMLGWLDATALTSNGEYTLPHISSDKAYKILTAKSGEYFWIETRGSANKWDAKFASGTWGGLLVTHVDRSSTYTSRWNNNTLNCYSAHPCFMPIRANSTGTSTTNASAGTAWLFAMNSKTSLNSATYPLFKPWSSSANDWTGPALDAALSYITYSAGTAKFTYSTNGTTPPIEPESVQLNKTSGSAMVGETLELTATVLPADASNKTVTWASDRPEVATVSATGVVTCVANGTAKITATTANDRVATCTVLVLAPMNEISASMLQNDAILSWEYEWDGAFKVELFKGEDKVGEYIANGNSVYIPMLSENTSYTATIYPVDGAGKTITAINKTKTFKTIANSTEFAAMGLMKGTFAATEQIPLRAINLPANMVSMEWQVDGKVAYAAVTLEPGKHVLRLTLVYNSDREEVITKTITVK